MVIFLLIHILSIQISTRVALFVDYHSQYSLIHFALTFFVKNTNRLQ